MKRNLFCAVFGLIAGSLIMFSVKLFDEATKLDRQAPADSAYYVVVRYPDHETSFLVRSRPTLTRKTLEEIYQKTIEISGLTNGMVANIIRLEE